MKSHVKTFSWLMLSSLATSSLSAAAFQPMKKGEWKLEVLETSMGPAAQALMKPETFCVDDKTTKNWEQRMKEEVGKSKMECDFKELEQSVSKIAYNVKCKGTEASAAKNMPIGSTVDGTFHIVRESDTSYLMDQDTKATGVGLPADALAKIPAAQRAALSGILASQKGGISIKSKHKYSFIKDSCDKPNKAK
ncbi:MAG: hypothetical protein EOP07_04500 [Proteobacteria bacterium]|nr:MAG: hypothetical protein EOP07_04500 [Pseudomonadota bacterium]